MKYALIKNDKVINIIECDKTEMLPRLECDSYVELDSLSPVTLGQGYDGVKFGPSPVIEKPSP